MAILLKTRVPGPKSQALMAERQAAVARGPFHVTPIFIAKGEGAVIEDVDGNRFIDFAAGISVVNVGHCNPEVVEAVREQAGQLPHRAFNVQPLERPIRVWAGPDARLSRLPFPPT